ncbi:hypothetical protein F5Y14DRAFT_410830 [Nemania sp. NC0429]|nr:hypothetical protein F5Y14DRAFT_410830 [Nemania sp. NC0429]
MGESLRSILCREPWYYDLERQCKIKFDEDGTGELVCRREIPIFIAGRIKWKALSEIGQPLTTSSDEDGGIKRLLELEITLTQQRSSWVSSRPRINEQLLNDEAFLPKTYKIKLEKGDFVSASDRTWKPAEVLSDDVPKFALRLTFDVSPYPPREQWKSSKGAPDAIKFWEWTEFVAERKA